MWVRASKLGDVEKVQELPDGSFLTSFKGYKHPVHGLLTDEALFATEMLKKYVIGWVMVVSHPFSFIREWFNQFNRYAFHITEQFVDVRHLSPAVKEFLRASISALGEDGKSFVLALCAILEHDKAYRYRLQDTMMCANREELIRNTRKEVVRLVKLYIQREHRPQYHGIKFIVYLAFLFYPRIKKWIIMFAIETNFEKYRLDVPDMYGCLREEAYDFMGKNYEERLEIWNKL